MRVRRPAGSHRYRLKIEQRYFSHILQTSEAQSMIRSLFVSLQEINKGARRPEGIKPTKFRKIGVVGAGFMGAGIAYVTAKAGIPVVLIDRDLEAAAKGKAYSEDLVKKGVQKGKTTKEEGEKLLSLITTSTDHADLADADLVIEAVFEDRDVKKAVTESIEAQIRPTRSMHRTPRRCRSPASPRTRSVRRTSSASTSSRQSTR
jgi:3-hydroxyacyl-CoA dehydrogenase/enoyl-CoA hydratase/3-hydroxybutyryl-CoA epimerase